MKNRRKNELKEKEIPARDIVGNVKFRVTAATTQLEFAAALRVEMSSLEQKMLDEFELCSAELAATKADA